MMIALNTLNVIVGLVFTWTVFSMGVMYIQEWIASRRNWRAKMLETTIGNILTDPALLNQFYNHPIIQSLHTGTNRGSIPSYIPASQFTQALLDIVSTAGTEASLLQQQLYRIQDEITGRTRAKKKHAQERLGLILAMIRRVLVDKTGSSASDSILNSVSIEMLALGNEIPRSKQAINKALSTVSALKSEIDFQVNNMGIARDLPPASTSRKVLEGSVALGVTHPRLKQTMDALFLTVPDIAWESDLGLEQVRANIEEWYGNSMARLTGWYKRRAHITTLLIGLFMAVILNVDSLTLANRIWSEPYRINSAIDDLQAIVQTQTGDPQSQTDQSGFSSLARLLGSINLPIGWLSIPQATASQTGPAIVPLSCVLAPINSGDIYGIKIGGSCMQIINAPLLSDLTGWALKALGILASTLAVSQGAPFWFDILKKIVNIRLTGLTPAESVKSFG